MTVDGETAIALAKELLDLRAQLRDALAGKKRAEAAEQRALEVIRRNGLGDDWAKVRGGPTP